MSLSLSYHDIHVTAEGLERSSIFELPYNVSLMCTRAGGWTLWSGKTLIGGEYDGDDKWLVIDVDGHPILDSRRLQEEINAEN